MKRILALVLLTAGCHEPFSNDDILFLKAAPQGLRLEVPQDGRRALRAAQADDEGPARFYEETRRAAEEVNAGVLSLLDIVDAVVAYEPTVRETDRRIWGPFPEGDAELALVVNRIPTSTAVRFTSTASVVRAEQYFEYAFVARPRGGGDDDYVTLFAGRSVPQASNRQGTGALFVDLDVISELDPGADDRGRILMGYDTRFGETHVELAVDPNRGGPFEARAAWTYVLEADGGGRFGYFVRENVLGAPDNEELLAIAARWMPDNRGRADVAVTQGDVPEIYFASECWDIRFTRVFLLSNIPDPAFARVGRPALCGPELDGPLFED